MQKQTFSNNRACVMNEVLLSERWKDWRQSNSQEDPRWLLVEKVSGAGKVMKMRICILNVAPNTRCLFSNARKDRMLSHVERRKHNEKESGILKTVERFNTRKGTNLECTFEIEKNKANNSNRRRNDANYSPENIVSESNEENDAEVENLGGIQVSSLTAADEVAQTLQLECFDTSQVISGNSK